MHSSAQRRTAAHLQPHFALHAVSKAATAGGTPQLVHGAQVGVRDGGHLCEVHPASLLSASACHADEQRTCLIIRLAHVALGKVGAQRGVIQAELRGSE